MTTEPRPENEVERWWREGEEASNRAADAKHEPVERGDLPEGQQSKGSSHPTAAVYRSKIVTDDQLDALLARVRAEVAEEIALALDAATNGIYLKVERAVEVAREHAGKRLDSPAGRLDRVWWLHRCTDSSGAGLVWSSGPLAAGEAPQACGWCGEAAMSGEWFTATKIDRLPKE